MTTVQGAPRLTSGRDAAADDPDGPGPPGDEGKVESVVKKWLVYEDEVVANQLQEEEIRRHYGLNRQTRQTVRGDIPVAKELQSGEELEAAIARQRQLDELKRRTENDERIAREIAERMAAGADQERERARLRRRQQQQQEAASADEATAATVPPQSSARVPPFAPASASASRTTAAAFSDPHQDTTASDEEMARRIQAKEQERYLRHQAEHGRHRAADAQQRRQPAAAAGRPRSDGSRLAAAVNGPLAANGSGPAGITAMAAEERLRSGVPSDAVATRSGAAHAGGGGSGGSGGSSGSSRARPTVPVEPAPPPPFVRGNPRQDVASRRLSGGTELASRLGRQPERRQQQQSRREDSGDFGDFFLPPGQGMSEDECRQLQEEQDAEIARLLQEQEHKRTGASGGSSSKLKQLEQHDAELARIMQEEERLRAQKRAIKQRQRALQEARAEGTTGHQLPPQQQQLIGTERSSAGDIAAGPIGSSAGPPMQGQTRATSSHRSGNVDDSRSYRLSNGNHGQPPRATPNVSASGGAVPIRAGGEGEGLYDSPWDLSRTEDQLLRRRVADVPIQDAVGADDVRLRSGDRIGNSNIAESIDPTYKRRSREFQKRSSGDFGLQSRPNAVLSVDSVPPAPTQPAPPPPSAARPAVVPTVIDVSQPTDWAPIPGQRRSQRRSKSKKGCTQQ